MINDAGNYDRDYKVPRHFEETRGPGEIQIMDTVLQVIRLCGAVIGLVLIVTGLVFALKLFGVIATTLNTPGNLQGLVEQWSRLVGNDSLKAVYEGQTMELGPLVAVGILGVGGLVLVSIAFRLITVGANVISITVGEKEAIKRLLRQVMPFALSTAKSGKTTGSSQ